MRLLRAALIVLIALPAAAAQPFPAGAVAADHEAASEAGAAMLRRGGNAVDAVVAASFALSVVRPESCGIGGGGFMIVLLGPEHPRGPARIAINYREQAPAAVGPDFFEHARPGASTHGGAAVGVPGTVAGLLYALEKLGSLPREVVLAPAIRLAEEGFAVDRSYVNSLAEARRAMARHDPGGERFAEFGRVFAPAEVKVGDVLRQPNKARALREIAARGRGGFYAGPVGEAIVAAVRADGGVLSLSDLSAFSVREGSPLEFDFHGRRVLTMPPPSSGGIAAAQILGVFGRTLPAGAAHNSAEYIHAFTEASKHAFADRARYLNDPECAGCPPVPVKAMLDPGVLDERAATFDARRTRPAAFYGLVLEGHEDGGTSHLSAVDAKGNAVSCTETVNLEFGSLIVVPEYGILLNNQMDDFTTRRGAPNAFGLRQSDRNLPAPGKRPLSSMTPMIVLEGERPVLLAGANGGPRIISATVQAMLNVLLFDMSAAEAVGAPRVHHQWMPDVLRLDAALARDAALVEALEGKGHRLGERSPSAAVQLIRLTPGGWDAASDPRKGGRPAGH